MFKMRTITHKYKKCGQSLLADKPKSLLQLESRSVSRSTTNYAYQVQKCHAIDYC